ncbi:MAG: hypothetical protein OHK0037_11890 [Elainellaceae cyanobacterium]
MLGKIMFNQTSNQVPASVIKSMSKPVSQSVSGSMSEDTPRQGLKQFRNMFFKVSLASLGAIATACSVVVSSPLVGPAKSEALVAAAQFPNPVVDVAASPGQTLHTAVFAGGCFWGIEAIFESLRGVDEAVSGYSGGSAETANYERINVGDTGHAEAVLVTYDPSQISYGQLLKVYFSVAHDPTQLNRQGADIGTHYRSAIFYANEEQRQSAATYIQQLEEAGVFADPIVTQLEPLTEFYAAEDYHQDFIAHNPAHPYVVLKDLPKLALLQQQFPELQEY